MSDTSDFDRWYRDVRPDLIRTLVIGRGHDVDIAAEAVDEAMVRALENWSRVRTMASPKGWAYTVAVNQFRRQFRRRTMERDRIELMVEASPCLDPAETITLWKAVSEMDPTEREALVLRYIAGFTEAEVAAAMNMAVGSTSSLLSRARRRLHKELNPTEEATRGT